MEKVTLGGDRVGSGNKMQVEMHGFQRSNFNLDYTWRSTMSAGTLVPFMCEIGLPGDTIDIELFADCVTKPTVGPLFGSFKQQFDVYQIPFRLYNSWLHNNKLGVGNRMQDVKMPMLTQACPQNSAELAQMGKLQINPSCILAYLGINGIGINYDGGEKNRDFNAVPLISYYEIFKNYYSNKQEETAYVIHGADINDPIISVEAVIEGDSQLISEFPSTNNPIEITGVSGIIQVNYEGGNTITPEMIIFQIATGALPIYMKLSELKSKYWPVEYGNNGNNEYMRVQIAANEFSGYSIYNWQYDSIGLNEVRLTEFNLEYIDKLREDLLAKAGDEVFNIDDTTGPWNYLNSKNQDGTWFRTLSQEGLLVKTYQSDIFNNWLNTAWVDQISNQSAVSILEGQFTIDEFIIKKKVWELLNRIAVSGGSFNDWVTATYDQKIFNRAESPIWVGGMSQELVFQEVVSNSQSQVDNNKQPLGTLAGRGVIAKNSRKGGKVVVKCDEHCIIMGIVSITPRIDYSQGNRFYVHLKNWNEFHKPNLDQIGFQDLISEDMAYFGTYWRQDQGAWIQNSVGKQPAWINYMTNYNRTYGNFAIQDSEMFMTLNRRYEFDANIAGGLGIKDVTTYIDPAKFNYLFAQTSLDSQNFWMQIGVNMEARRKMSAKIMPSI